MPSVRKLALWAGSTALVPAVALPVSAQALPGSSLALLENSTVTGETVALDLPLLGLGETETRTRRDSSNKAAAIAQGRFPAAEEKRAPEETEAADAERPLSPLEAFHPGMPTAQHLRQGEVVFSVRNRLFDRPGTVEETGTAGFRNFAVRWGVTDDLELTLSKQLVDTGGPGQQGPFNVDREGESAETFFLSDQELTLEVKQNLWESETNNQSLSGLVSLSIGAREFDFNPTRGDLSGAEGVRRGVVPALRLPYTFSRDRWQVTVAPTVAFFDEENALHLHRPPTQNPGSFGTTFGVVGSASYRLTPELKLWGDAFVPLSGNNSINRDSGGPDKTIAFNAGARYLVNPRLAVDAFASNTLGTTGPLSLTADSSSVALGAGLRFMPDFVAANERYPDRFGGERDPSPATSDGFAFLDGGTVPDGKVRLHLLGGSQGILSAARYSPLRDLELGLYLDAVSGTFDESEQGASAKVRVLDQADGDPLTASVVGTLGMTNEPFLNFANNDRDAFDQANIEEDLPFFLQVDDGTRGELFVVTLSAPLHYRFENGAAAWATPIAAFVQRNGTEIAGLNVGGSLPLSERLDVIGEVGANFAGEGNAIVGQRREDAIPWTVGVRFDPTHFLGLNPQEPLPDWNVSLYATNRVGASPFHSLRVRADNDLAVGGGFSIQF